MTDAPKIIYTHTDEAPALATYSFLPIVQSFVKGSGIAIETRDISLAGRLLAHFSDQLPAEQQGSDALVELSELATKLESAIDSAERNADYWRDRADWSVAAESVPSEADGVPGQADFRFVDCTRTSATETTHTGRDSRPN